jgi:hypothetical protein
LLDDPHESGDVEGESLVITIVSNFRTCIIIITFGICVGSSPRALLLNCGLYLALRTYFYSYRGGRDSDWLRAGRPRGRSSSSGMCKNVLFSTSSKPALGPTQFPIHLVPGALSLGVKRSGSEADHSPPTSAEVKKMWICTSTLPYASMA